MKPRMVFSLTGFFVMSLAVTEVFASAGITYHGRLLAPNGQPVTASSVTFRLQIRTPGAENCLLYEEQQVKNLSASNGVFALVINDGSATVVNTEPFTLDRIFQNRGNFSFASGKCAGALSYTPSITDGRRLSVDFNDGTFGGWESVPTQNINYVPMSIEAMTVGGYGAANLLRVVDGSGEPATLSPLTQTQYNSLVDILNGTAGIAGNAAGFTGSLAGDVTGSQGATVVTKIQGRAVDTAAPSNGQALVWSAANSRWEPGTVSGGGGGDWSTLTGKPASFPSDWSTLANKPATFAPSAHSHPINEISSGTGAYFNYSPNGIACGAGEILKWDTGGGGRWICGVDAGSAGALASLTVNAPLVKTGTGSDPVLSLSDASTSAKGVVQLASSADTTAGLVVQADDTRLTNGRAPTGAAGGELSGSYPNPTVVASVSSSASSLVRRSAGGQIQSASADFGSVGVNNGGGSVVTIQTPAAFTSYTLKLPASAGGNGQILTSNGSDMIWSNASSITASNVSGIVAIVNGGTGASTASAARTNLGITATGDALVTAADAAAARTAISAMQNVTPGTNGNVLTASGGVWTSAPFTVNAANVGSAVGGYFTYKPNNGTCANGEVLKWETAGGGRWVCGTDISSTGGTGVASVSATAPVTVDNTDPNNPRVEIDDATTTSTGVVQLATSSDTSAGLVVQANDTRLTNSRAPSGTAGGDLTGNYPNPTIAKLQTKDITLTVLATGNVLKYDGTKWVNAADADSLGGLSCSNGDVALYSGGVWSCVAASTTSVNNSVVRRDGTGLITSAGGNFGSLMVNNGTSTITLGTPAAFTNYTLKLPSDAGSNGQILTSNGADMVWANASSITANNVSGIVAVANGGTGASTASAARTNLGATATGSSLFTATDATAARTAISAVGSTDSRLAPMPAAGNATNYVRVNAGGTAYEARSPANVLSDIGAMTAVAPGTSGNVLVSNGTSWTSGAVPTDTTKVSKTGDTMSGSLTLPADGLVLGTNQLVASGGKVGIGTAAPVAALSVVSAAGATGDAMTIRNTNSAGYADIGLYDDTNTLQGWMGWGNSGSGAPSSLNLWTTNASPISFATNSVSRMTISAAGNVGIGVGVAGQKLSVAGTVESTTGGFKFPDGSVQTTAVVAGTSQTAWVKIASAVASSSTTTMSITGLNGDADEVYRVVARITQAGIGSNVNYGLTINGDTGPNYGYQSLFTVSGTSYVEGYTDVSSPPFGTTAGSGQATTADGIMHVKSGKVRDGVGYFSSKINGEAIDFVGTSAWSWSNTAANVTSMTITSSPSNKIAAGSYFEIWAQRPVGGGGDNLGNHTATANIRLGSYYLSGDGGNEGIRVDASGNVGIGTTSPDQLLTVYNGSTTGRYTTSGWTHSSDARLKHDVAPLSDSLDKILKLQGVEYKLNADPLQEKQIGFIAQQVEPVFPEVVKTDQDGFKSMVYANLVAPLVEAVKTLHDRLLGLEGRTRELASVAAEKADKTETETLRADGRAKDERIRKLEEENAAMKARLDRLERKIGN